MSKTAPQKIPVNTDWPSHYIVYRLRERGQSLRRLARLNNFCSTGSVVMVRAWPKMQQIIADAIGVAPREIWPSRYEDNGEPKTGLFASANNRQDITATPGVNVYTARVA